MKKILSILLFAAVLFCTASCKKDEGVTYEYYLACYDSARYIKADKDETAGLIRKEVEAVVENWKRDQEMNWTAEGSSLEASDADAIQRFEAAVTSFSAEIDPLRESLLERYPTVTMTLRWTLEIIRFDGSKSKRLTHARTVEILNGDQSL